MARLEALNPAERKHTSQWALDLAHEQIDAQIQRSLDRAKYLGEVRHLDYWQIPGRYLQPWRIPAFVHRQHLRIAREPLAASIAHDIEKAYVRTGIFVEPALGFSRQEIKTLAGRGKKGRKLTAEDATTAIENKKATLTGPANEGNLKMHPEGTGVFFREAVSPAELPTLEYYDEKIEALTHKIDATKPIDRRPIDKRRLELLEKQRERLQEGITVFGSQEAEHKAALARINTYVDFRQALDEGVILLEQTDAMKNHVDAAGNAAPISLPPEAVALNDIVVKVRQEFTIDNRESRIPVGRDHWSELKLARMIRREIEDIRDNTGKKDPVLRDAVKELFKHTERTGRFKLKSQTTESSGRTELDLARAIFAQIREFRAHQNDASLKLKDDDYTTGFYDSAGGRPGWDTKNKITVVKKPQFKINSNFVYNIASRFSKDKVSPFMHEVLDNHTIPLEGPLIDRLPAAEKAEVKPITDALKTILTDVRTEVIIDGIDKKPKIHGKDTKERKNTRRETKQEIRQLIHDKIEAIPDADQKHQLRMLLEDAEINERHLARIIYKQVREFRAHQAAMAGFDLWFDENYTKAVTNTNSTHGLKYPQNPLRTLLYNIPVAGQVIGIGEAYLTSPAKNLRVILPAAAAIGIGVAVGVPVLSSPWFWAAAGAAFGIHQLDHMRKRKVIEHKVERQVLQGKKTDASDKASERFDNVFGIFNPVKVWKYARQHFNRDQEEREAYDRLFRGNKVREYSQFSGPEAYNATRKRNSLANLILSKILRRSDGRYSEKRRAIGEIDNAPQLRKIALTQEIGGAVGAGFRTGLLDRATEQLQLYGQFILPNGKVDTDNFARLRDMQRFTKEGRMLWESNLERAIMLTAEMIARVRVFEHAKVPTPFTSIRGKTLQETAQHIRDEANQLYNVIQYVVPRLRTQMRDEIRELNSRIAHLPAGDPSRESLLKKEAALSSEVGRFAGNPMLAQFLNPRTGQLDPDALQEEVLRMARQLDPTIEIKGIQVVGQNVFNTPEAREALGDRIANGIETGVISAAMMWGAYTAGANINNIIGLIDQVAA